jgi:hypothetical protein
MSQKCVYHFTEIEETKKETKSIKRVWQKIAT